MRFTLLYKPTDCHRTFLTLRKQLFPSRRVGLLTFFNERNHRVSFPYVVMNPLPMLKL